MDNRSERTVDLHTHTNFSDGLLSPEELVEEAVWRGLSAVAVTDHDNVDALPRAMAAARERGLELVPGVEMSCQAEGREAHIVGLFVEPNDRLRARLAEIRHHRETRMQQMLDRLGEMGVELSFADVPQDEGGSFGRPHLAQLLVEKGHAKNLGDAFGRLIGDGCPGYVAKRRFTIPEAVELIHECRGLAILAHPGTSALIDDIPRFAERGIDGVEVYYGKHTLEVTQRVHDIATELGLLFSGGSDFHGNGMGPNVGVPRIPYKLLKKLRERKEQLWPAAS